MTTTTDIHHLAAAYALDALDGHERPVFEAHYQSCDVCRVDVLDHRETLAELAVADPRVPSTDVRALVLAEIAHTRQLSPLLPDGISDLAERRRRRRRTSTSFLAAAAAVVLVMSGAFLAVRGDGADSFGDQLAAVAEQPDAGFVTLEGPGPGNVRVAWSASAGRAVFIGDGLPDPGPDAAYELWLIDETGPIPMELLGVPDGGGIRASVDLVGVPTSWGVTVEPATGSPAPTGEILYAAEV